MFQPGSGVDTLKLTPTHIHLLEYMNGARRRAQGDRGGEELTPQHIATLRKIDPAIEIYNEYGPTEATVGCIVERVEDAPSTVLIGRPIADTRVYMLDDALRPVPLGVPGNLPRRRRPRARLPPAARRHRREIRRASVPRRSAHLSHRRHRPVAARRTYPVLRARRPVKIRGHRVELGEIEAAIAAHEDVVGAAVMLRESAHGVRKLAAYVRARRA